MRCPRCDTYMDKREDSDIWYCPDCGYNMSEHSIFPLLIGIAIICIVLALI